MIFDPDSERAARIRETLLSAGLQDISNCKNLIEFDEALQSASQGVGQSIDLLIISGVDEASPMRVIVKSFRVESDFEDKPILFLSPKANTSLMQACFGAGVNDYLRFPFDEAEFICRVEALRKLGKELRARSAREKDLREINFLLKALNRELNRLSQVDALTNLPNRRFFQESFEREHKRALREESYISVLMIDIDYFKLYNDHYGHLAGDECLQQVANALRSSLRRPGDLVARYGGEEFVVLLPQTSPVGAQVVGERLRRCIWELGIEHEKSPSPGVLSISLGLVSQVPTKSSRVLDLLTEADEALYQAKEAGRNQLQICSSSAVLPGREMATN